MKSAQIAYTGLIRMHAQEAAADGNFKRTREFSKDRAASIDKDLIDIGRSLHLQAHEEIRLLAIRIIEGASS